MDWRFSSTKAEMEIKWKCRISFTLMTTLFCVVQMKGTLASESNTISFWRYFWFACKLGKRASIFSVNSDHSIQKLAAILCCRIESSPTIYLGIPLGEEIMMLMSGKGWLRNVKETGTMEEAVHLFLGRVTLMNSVLDGVSIHIMSLFPIKGGSRI